MMRFVIDDSQDDDLGAALLGFRERVGRHARLLYEGGLYIKARG
jgi:hypothetical protein